MSKSFLSFIFLLLFSVSLYPDEETIELGHLFDDGVTHWYDISFRCSELVPYFYELGEQDSLSFILQYWEEEAPTMEPIRRVWTLNQIAQNTFEDEYISTTMIDDFIDYLLTLEEQKSDSLDWRTPDAKGPKYISGEFNVFTKQLAKELLSFTDLSDDEYMICLFYAHEFDEFWRLLKSGDARFTSLEAQIKKYRKQNESGDIHFGFFTGYYSPRKDFALLGEKAHIGALVGIEWQRLSFDCSLLFQFPNSKNTYGVYYEKELYETKHYFRFLIALEPAFKLYDWRHTRINLLSGIGADIVEVVPEGENPVYAESISIAGLNLSLGVGVHHFIKKGYPYALQYQLRYEFSGYDTHGGTDLSSGEAVSFRLGFSWDANKRKHEFKKYFD